MRDRALLTMAVALLFGGLGVWVLLGRREGVDDDRRRYVEALRTPPPLGEDLHAADPRARAAADACRVAGLGDAPIRALFEREGETIVGVGVEGRDALDVWRALRAVVGTTHLHPVILGDGFSLADHADAAAHTSLGVDAILSRASSLDLDAWLAARPTPELGSPMPPAARGERYLSVLDPVLGMPVLPVAIALLPAARAADAPAWLAFGNWQGCPDAAVHVAVLARLEALAHVELVAITRDRIELHVPTPPTDPAERDRLADLLARWAPRALDGEHASVASWSSTFVTSRAWSIVFPRAASRAR